MSSEHQLFKNDCKQNISLQGSDRDFKEASKNWFRQSITHRYSYNFECLGRPIIQYPQDIVLIQEIIYQVKPDLIIETGIAHGGSLILSASQLCLLDIMEGVNPKNSSRAVLGIDIEIRPHNKNSIEKHPLNFKIRMIEGSSISPDIIKSVEDYAQSFKKILLLLDSNHTEDHVLAELNAYSHLVSKDSYCVVYDTCIENLNEGGFPDRPWDVGNNPMTAINKWIPNHPEYKIDYEIDKKLMISVATSGYLKKII